MGTVPKTRTLDQIEAMKEKAARFVRDVVGDPERAAEFEAMSPEEYAAGKRIEIKNPASANSSRAIRRLQMARPTYKDLKDRIDELEDENQDLNDKLDSVMDIVADEDDDGQDDDGEGDDGEDDDQD
jgi:cell shape-determining protein MreC